MDGAEEEGRYREIGRTLDDGYEGWTMRGDAVGVVLDRRLIVRSSAIAEMDCVYVLVEYSYRGFDRINLCYGAVAAVRSLETLRPRTVRCRYRAIL